MRKKMTGWLCAGLLACALIGCTSEKPADRQETQTKQETEQEDPGMEEELITREYLIENCGVTEEELEGIDVDAFIAHYHLQESNVGKMNIHALLRSYQGEPQEEPYAYLLQTSYAEEALTEEEIDQVTVAALYLTEGTYQETLLLNKKEEKGVWGKEENLLQKYSERGVLIPYGAEEQAGFGSLLRSCQVNSWKTDYEGNNGDTTGSFGWALYLELEDGSVHCYTGSGVLGENKPEQWNTLVNGMKAMFGA